jgi:hypothetical protein
MRFDTFYTCFERLESVVNKKCLTRLESQCVFYNAG